VCLFCHSVLVSDVCIHPSQHKHLTYSNSYKVSRESARIISEILIKDINTRLCLVQQELIHITCRRSGNYDKDATNSTSIIIGSFCGLGLFEYPLGHPKL